MNSEDFKKLTDSLIHDYGLAVLVEHEKIMEFYEAEIPLFKLILATKKDGTPLLVISFHIDIDAPIAILWYLRIRTTVEPISVTASYMKDDGGETVVGQAASILHRQKIENAFAEALENQGLEEEEEHDLTSSTGLEFAEFDRLQPKKGQRYN